MMTFGEILEDAMSRAIPDDGQPITFLECSFDDTTDSDGDDWWDE